jgi:septum formation protein
MSRLRVVLASASPRRRELLTLIGIAHEVIPSDIDESERRGEKPADHAERLAREKTIAVAHLHPDALVIGADTIVVIDDRVLGKPRTQDEAAMMLRTLKGRTHRVFTAVAVARGTRLASGVEEVEVAFRDLTDPEIADYVATGEPMDKAGAYGIQGYGATIVRRIDGDYFAVMGLAIGRMIDLIRRLGFRYEFRGGIVE